jgi:hypothetical protein
MKNIRLIIPLAFVLLFAAVSCDDDEYVQYGNETGQVVTDPFLQILTPVLAFQAGTPSYTMQFNVVNGTKRINAVEVYKVFTDAATGSVSNEALLGTYNLDAGNFTSISDDLTYEELKAGLTVNGGPLPDNETDLAIGSQWQFRFVGKTAGGDIALPGSIRVGVLSRFAGIYEVVESAYYRIGVLTAEWTGQTRFIGSVDENTFSYNDFWGNFAWGGNAFHFDLNPDNTIRVPIVDPPAALFGGNRPIDCTVNPQEFSVFSCTPEVNILIPDEVNGHHTIVLLYGYFTDGSGPREFREVLRKL